MKIKLKTKREIVKGIMLFEFDTLGQIVNFEPGQFFTLTLINPTFTDKRGNSRIFGFVNSPNEKVIQILTKIGPSAFKKSLMENLVGINVELDKVNGLLELPQNPNQSLVFIAGGIGIAPVMSVIRFNKELGFKYKITLIYIFEDKMSAPFINELENYSKEDINFKLITAQSLNSDIITTKLPNLNDNLYFTKGEQHFVISAMKILKELGITNDKISMEIFTGY